MTDYIQLDIFALIHQDVLDEPVISIYNRDDAEYEPITRKEYVKMLQTIKQDIENQLDKYLTEYPGAFDD